MKKILLLLAILPTFAVAQNTKDISTQTITATGQTVTFPNPPGSGSLSFEYTFSGTATGVTITSKGCMPGGTCNTLTATTGSNPYTGTSAGIAQFGSGNGYAYYTVTATYSGSATITVSMVGIQARTSGSSSSSTLSTPPAISSLLFDYKMIAGEPNASTQFADYAASEGSPVGVGDCVFIGGANPVRLSGGGATFGLAGSAQGCTVPAAANTMRSFAALVAPALPNATFGYGLGLIGSNQTSSSLSLGIDSSGRGFVNYSGGSAVSSSYDSTAGLSCVVHQVGQSGDSTFDTFYLNGRAVGSYVSRGRGVMPTGGNYLLGSSGNGLLWFGGTIYRAMGWSSFISAADAQSACALLASDGITKGAIDPSLVLNTGTNPTVACVGDSIAYGSLGTAPCTLLTGGLLSSMTITTNAIPGSAMSMAVGNVGPREAAQCSTKAMNYSILEAGTNDLASGTSAAALWNLTKSYAGQLRAAWAKKGCVGKIGAQTILSRFTIDAGTGTGTRDTYNTLVLTQALASGFDFIADAAANPLLGATGASSNTTNFNADKIHPTLVGDQYLANAYTYALQYQQALLNPVPTTITAATYTMGAGDILMNLNPSASQTITLPNCLGQTGAIYRFMNSQSANTVTLKTAAAGQTINGTDYSSTGLTFASNSTLRLRCTVASPTGYQGLWLTE